MTQSARRYLFGRLAVGLLVVTVGGGCHVLRDDISIAVAGIPQCDAPRELSKVTLPLYVIEPPDILLIDALRAIPKPPYRIQPLDILSITTSPTLPDAEIAGLYPVEPTGAVNLGTTFGSVPVVGLTVKEAAEIIRLQVAEFVQDPEVSVSLTEIAGTQQIAGEHLVGPDGTVRLGSYGNVKIVGMTLDEAEIQIEEHLSQFLQDPDVSLDVFSFNSKVYYVITEGAGLGDRVIRFPVTGNETVLDAIAQIAGLDQVSSKKMWISRPTLDGHAQILPVDWKAITKEGLAGTNYQILPGDRVFVAEDKLVALNTFVTKAIDPFERMFGFMLLGTSGVQELRFFHVSNRGGGF